MAELQTLNGRKLKAGVTVEEKIGKDGKVLKVLKCPIGCKNPYVDDDEKKVVKKTTKPNPTKDTILEKLLESFQSFSYDGKIYRTKEGKFCLQMDDGKWFTMALTANKIEPKDKKVYGDDGD